MDVVKQGLADSGADSSVTHMTACVALVPASVSREAVSRLSRENFKVEII